MRQLAAAFPGLARWNFNRDLGHSADPRLWGLRLFRCLTLPNPMVGLHFCDSRHFLAKCRGPQRRGAALRALQFRDDHERSDLSQTEQGAADEGAS